MEFFFILVGKCKVGFISQIWVFYNLFLVIEQKVAPQPLCRVLCKKLENYFPKIYIGRGPISKHSTPRVSTIPQTNSKHTSQCQRQIQTPR
jgi:hypothetical protein